MARTAPAVKNLNRISHHTNRHTKVGTRDTTQFTLRIPAIDEPSDQVKELSPPVAEKLATVAVKIQDETDRLVESK